MPRIRTHRREGMDTAVLDADFEVQREAMFGEICGCVSLCTHRVVVVSDTVNTVFRAIRI